MFAAFRTTRRKSSHVALAIALATGTAVSGVAYAPAAFAQEAQAPSRAFGEAYNLMVPLVQGETQDYEAARAMLPSLLAAVENARDNDLAGSIQINIGGHFSDRQMQRRGLEQRLASGLVAPEQVGLLHWYAGNFAIEVEEYAAARDHLNAAMAAGYAGDGADIVNLIARTYTEEGNDRGAYDYLSRAIADADAAGTPVREAWLRNVLQFVYEEGMVDEASAVILRLVRTSDEPDRAWSDGLRIVSQMLEVSEDARVDLYRLMIERDALVDRPNMVEFIEAIDPRLMSNEVLEILRIGVAAGEFQTEGDGYYTEVNTIAQARAPIDRNGIAGIVSEGRGGDALDAMNAGDVLFSLDDYAQAEDMYALGLERGFDGNTAHMRIGINQAMQGEYDAALASFASVGGERATIAALWTAHVEALRGM
ncbi:hypothetical protein [Erythrobacter sp. EC-HK427]|uniref:hypothetical protein n=1 Tax=Erythrobacter sp. EC-HK427 TaxID=2038396 RepID=UPI001252E880|nr:hypothetical protein [Erythrobacter sp. EC-HK427]VVT16825.1 TPR repeat protein [Erythrobacter sp. EC-HK427]